LVSCGSAAQKDQFWTGHPLPYHGLGPSESTIRRWLTVGCTQPERPRWNRFGYGGNAVQNIPLLVR
jgi:hypothetical protein